MAPKRRVVTTPRPALRQAIDGAEALHTAAYAALAEGRSVLAARLLDVVRDLERDIGTEVRRTPEALSGLGRAGWRYRDHLWPELQDLPFQKCGRISIDDLAFLDDLRRLPLPRTPKNIARLRAIAARLEAYA